jgi:ParB family chromosome partitioning protein
MPPPVVPLVPAAAPQQTGERVLQVPPWEIERSPWQPRTEFSREALEDLVESIRQNGIIQPLTCRRRADGKLELICGERRQRAATEAGLKLVPVVVRDVDDATAAVMTMTENLTREDLNPIEEAQSYKTLQDTFNLTQAEVAEKLGKGRATIANATRLLELPDEVKQLVATSLLSVGHAKVLLSVDGEKDRILLARDCVNNNLSVRALENKVLRLHTPVEERQKGTPDLPAAYVKNLAEKMKRHLGCAVRVTPGVTHQSGRHTKGVVEIDFFDNDDLDRIIRMIGVTVD